jgi:CheY-specific phosphatase CheX
MPEALEQVLSRATANVLEKMFFTGFVDESAALRDVDARVAVRLAFDGDRRGELMLTVSTSAASVLTADFLGIESGEEPAQDQVSEVISQLANMICGDTLSALERGALHLSKPELLPSGGFVPLPGASLRSFDLGNGMLTVALTFLDGPGV